ncbi:oxidoreductase [Zavarzinia sp.]|uniref:oxidoreductase n=1 Tax=Zavarzinia sp. TaxID=2027920 RepID=UPI0035647D78
MKTILVTGVSTGLGRALAVAALAAGHRVVGTLRRAEDLAAFEALAPGRAIGRLLDVTDFAAVRPLVDAVEAEAGPIDALVNNAGFGLEGTIEETALEDVRRQFDVNVFGAIAVIQAVLPHMRARRAGHILNVTSMGGFITMPGIGFYHGTKFALEAISETLGKEVKHLGIKVTAIEPGSFRTDWAGRSMVRAEARIADYDEVFAPRRQTRLEMSGHQPGDPAKAAAAMLAVIAMDEPPAHLLLGRDATRLVGEKLAALGQEFAAYRDLSHSTDFAA